MFGTLQLYSVWIYDQLDELIIYEPQKADTVAKMEIIVCLWYENARLWENYEKECSSKNITRCIKETTIPSSVIWQNPLELHYRSWEALWKYRIRSLKLLKLELKSDVQDILEFYF